jgi:hypothetical protein
MLGATGEWIDIIQTGRERVEPRILVQPDIIRHNVRLARYPSSGLLCRAARANCHLQLRCSGRYAYFPVTIF